MTQQPADSMPRVPAEDEPRIQRLAVLALVFAVLVPPVGIALGIQVLRRTRRDSADGKRAIAALLVAFAVGIGDVVLLLTSTTGASTPSTSAAAPAARPDPKGVVTACGVVMPALGQARSDVAEGTTADQYGQVLTRLANTIVSGASATTDSMFLDHVGQLSQAFQKAWQDSSNGMAPAAVADELTAAGAPVRRDCAAAGYHP